MVLRNRWNVNGVDVLGRFVERKDCWTISRRTIFKEKDSVVLLKDVVLSELYIEREYIQIYSREQLV